MIELVNVTRNYGAKAAVRELNLTVPAGELLAFLGPNGAGKTTTIKMIVGLLRPTSGTVRLGGYDVTSHPRESNRLLGYVPDEPYLYDKLTGREFMQFIVDMYGVDPRVARDRIEREIARFELADFVDRLAETYSHGMKQRLAFASALLHDPAVLVIDEPMVGLDPRSGRLLKNLLRDLARQGTCIFMSTHTLAVAEEIADRIGIFDRGTLRFLGTVTQLRQTLARHESTLEHLFLELTAPLDEALVVTDSPFSTVTNGHPDEAATSRRAVP